MPLIQDPIADDRMLTAVVTGLWPNVARLKANYPGAMLAKRSLDRHVWVVNRRGGRRH